MLLSVCPYSAEPSPAAVYNWSNYDLQTSGGGKALLDGRGWPHGRMLLVWDQWAVHSLWRVAGGSLS